MKTKDAKKKNLGNPEDSGIIANNNNNNNNNKREAEDGEGRAKCPAQYHGRCF